MLFLRLHQPNELEDATEGFWVDPAGVPQPIQGPLSEIFFGPDGSDTTTRAKGKGRRVDPAAALFDLDGAQAENLNSTFGKFPMFKSRPLHSEVTIIGLMSRARFRSGTDVSGALQSRWDVVCTATVALRQGPPLAGVLLTIPTSETPPNTDVVDFYCEGHDVCPDWFQILVGSFRVSPGAMKTVRGALLRAVQANRAGLVLKNMPLNAELLDLLQQIALSSDRAVNFNAGPLAHRKVYPAPESSLHPPPLVEPGEPEVAEGGTFAVPEGFRFYLSRGYTEPELGAMHQFFSLRLFDLATAFDTADTTIILNPETFGDLESSISITSTQVLVEAPGLLARPVLQFTADGLSAQQWRRLAFSLTRPATVFVTRLANCPRILQSHSVSSSPQDQAQGPVSVDVADTAIGQTVHVLCGDQDFAAVLIQTMHPGALLVDICPDTDESEVFVGRKMIQRETRNFSAFFCPAWEHLSRGGAVVLRGLYAHRTLPQSLAQMLVGPAPALLHTPDPALPPQLSPIRGRLFVLVSAAECALLQPWHYLATIDTGLGGYLGFLQNKFAMLQIPQHRTLFEAGYRFLREIESVSAAKKKSIASEPESETKPVSSIDDSRGKRRQRESKKTRKPLSFRSRSQGQYSQIREEPDEGEPELEPKDAQPTETTDGNAAGGSQVNLTGVIEDEPDEDGALFSSSIFHDLIRQPTWPTPLPFTVDINLLLMVCGHVLTMISQNPAQSTSAALDIWALSTEMSVCERFGNVPEVSAYLRVMLRVRLASALVTAGTGVRSPIASDLVLAQVHKVLDTSSSLSDCVWQILSALSPIALHTFALSLPQQFSALTPASPLVESVLAFFSNTVPPKARAFYHIRFGNEWRDRLNVGRALVHQPSSSSAPPLVFSQSQIRATEASDLDRVLHHLTQHCPVFLFGPTGSGKTHLLKEAAEALRVPLFRAQLGPFTARLDLVEDDNSEASGAGVVRRFAESTQGGLLLLDEITLITERQSSTFSFLNAALWPRVMPVSTGFGGFVGQRTIAFPDGKILPLSDRHFIGCTGNPSGFSADRHVPLWVRSHCLWLHVAEQSTELLTSIATTQYSFLADADERRHAITTAVEAHLFLSHLQKHAQPQPEATRSPAANAPLDSQSVASPVEEWADFDRTFTPREVQHGAHLAYVLLKLSDAAASSGYGAAPRGVLPVVQAVLKAILLSYIDNFASPLCLHLAAFSISRYGFDVRLLMLSDISTFPPFRMELAEIQTHASQTGQKFVFTQVHEQLLFHLWIHKALFLAKLHDPVLSQPPFRGQGKQALIYLGPPGIGKEYSVYFMFRDLVQVDRRDLNTPRSPDIAGNTDVDERERIVHMVWDGDVSGMRTTVAAMLSSGGVLHVEEINFRKTELTEGLLNGLDSQPNFLVVGTANPFSREKGRHSFSPALRARAAICTLSSLSAEDVASFAQQNADPRCCLSPQDAQLLAQMHTHVSAVVSRLASPDRVPTPREIVLAQREYASNSIQQVLSSVYLDRFSLLVPEGALLTPESSIGKPNQLTKSPYGIDFQLMLRALLPSGLFSQPPTLRLADDLPASVLVVADSKALTAAVSVVDSPEFPVIIARVAAAAALLLFSVQHRDSTLFGLLRLRILFCAQKFISGGGVDAVASSMRAALGTHIQNAQTITVDDALLLLPPLCLRSTNMDVCRKVLSETIPTAWSASEIARANASVTLALSAFIFFFPEDAPRPTAPPLAVLDPAAPDSLLPPTSHPDPSSLTWNPEGLGGATELDEFAAEEPEEQQDLEDGPLIENGEDREDPAVLAANALAPQESSNDLQRRQILRLRVRPALRFSGLIFGLLLVGAAVVVAAVALTKVSASEDSEVPSATLSFPPLPTRTFATQTQALFTPVQTPIQTPAQTRSPAPQTPRPPSRTRTRSRSRTRTASRRTRTRTKRTRTRSRSSTRVPTVGTQTAMAASRTRTRTKANTRTRTMSQTRTGSQRTHTRTITQRTRTKTVSRRTRTRTKRTRTKTKRTKTRSKSKARWSRTRTAPLPPFPTAPISFLPSLFPTETQAPLDEVGGVSLGIIYPLIAFFASIICSCLITRICLKYKLWRSCAAALEKIKSIWEQFLQSIQSCWSPIRGQVESPPGEFVLLDPSIEIRDRLFSLRAIANFVLVQMFHRQPLAEPALNLAAFGLNSFVWAGNGVVSRWRPRSFDIFHVRRAFEVEPQTAQLRPSTAFDSLSILASERALAHVTPRTAVFLPTLDAFYLELLCDASAVPGEVQFLSEDVSAASIVCSRGRWLLRLERAWYHQALLGVPDVNKLKYSIFRARIAPTGPPLYPSTSNDLHDSPIAQLDSVATETLTDFVRRLQPRTGSLVEKKKKLQQLATFFNDHFEFCPPGVPDRTENALLRVAQKFGGNPAESALLFAVLVQIHFGFKCYVLQGLWGIGGNVDSNDHVAVGVDLGDGKPLVLLNPVGTRMHSAVYSAAQRHYYGRAVLSLHPLLRLRFVPMRSVVLPAQLLLESFGAEIQAIMATSNVLMLRNESVETRFSPSTGKLNIARFCRAQPKCFERQSVPESRSPRKILILVPPRNVLSACGGVPLPRSATLSDSQSLCLFWHFWQMLIEKGFEIRFAAVEETASPTTLKSGTSEYGGVAMSDPVTSLAHLIYLLEALALHELRTGATSSTSLSMPTSLVASDTLVLDSDHQWSSLLQSAAGFYLQTLPTTLSNFEVLLRVSLVAESVVRSDRGLISSASNPAPTAWEQLFGYSLADADQFGRTASGASSNQSSGAEMVVSVTQRDGGAKSRRLRLYPDWEEVELRGQVVSDRHPAVVLFRAALQCGDNKPPFEVIRLVDCELDSITPFVLASLPGTRIILSGCVVHTPDGLVSCTSSGFPVPEEVRLHQIEAPLTLDVSGLDTELVLDRCSPTVRLSGWAPWVQKVRLRADVFTVIELLSTLTERFGTIQIGLGLSVDGMSESGSLGIGQIVSAFSRTSSSQLQKLSSLSLENLGGIFPDLSGLTDIEVLKIRAPAQGQITLNPRLLSLRVLSIEYTQSMTRKRAQTSRLLNDAEEDEDDQPIAATQPSRLLLPQEAPSLQELIVRSQSLSGSIRIPHLAVVRQIILSVPFARISNLDSLAACTTLEEVTLKCSSIEHLSLNGDLRRLRVVDLTGCSGLVDLALPPLEAVDLISLEGCVALRVVSVHCPADRDRILLCVRNSRLWPDVSITVRNQTIETRSLIPPTNVAIDEELALQRGYALLRGAR
eukprot:TRINITY_DN522_c0_g1_i8.p1 TRINITY_DN522_c0_g1~~TRINITY_DN522_c0_g1_i8.p1  ORF type:complete len:3299 (-),score=542.60 TRINITY_DN522_c0_g1_i8:215-9928(-)